MSIKHYQNWKNAKTLGVIALVSTSVFLMALNHNSLNQLSQQVGAIALLGLSFILSEFLFITGALIMLTVIGVDISGQNRIHGWYKKIRYARIHIRTTASTSLSSRWFGLGFWLNFIGAVVSSLILLLGLITLSPIAGWGIGIVILIDLAATFAWRIPLHLKRRRISHHVSD